MADIVCHVYFLLVTKSPPVKYWKRSPVRRAGWWETFGRIDKKEKKRRARSRPAERKQKHPGREPWSAEMGDGRRTRHVVSVRPAKLPPGEASLYCAMQGGGNRGVADVR